MNAFELEREASILAARLSPDERLILDAIAAFEGITASKGVPTSLYAALHSCGLIERREDNWIVATPLGRRTAEILTERAAMIRRADRRYYAS
jgi:hypothetical protein